MKLRFDFRAYAFRFFLIGAIGSIAISATLSYALERKLAYRREETFAFAIAAPLKESKTAEFRDKLDHGWDPSVAQFNLYAYPAGRETPSSTFRVYLERSDLALLRKSQLGDDLSMFADVPESYQSETTLQKKGILVYQASSKEGKNANYIDYLEEDYYLFLLADSPHLGSLSSSSYTDAALVALGNFME